MRLLYISMTISMILISIVLGAGFTYFLMTNVSNLLNDTLLGSYISGAGSFLGGVIGGVVAFIVARSQIIAERELNQNNQNKKIKNQLLLLITELNSHLEIFQLIEKNKKTNIEIYRSSIILDVWKEVKFDLANEIETEDFNDLSNYYYDCNDFKNGLLPEYISLTEDEIQVRITIITGIIENLKSVKVKLK